MSGGASAPGSGARPAGRGASFEAGGRATVRPRERVAERDPLAETRRRLGRAVLFTLALLVVGTVVYRIIDGGERGWLDSLYMTVITLTTVGYGEIIPLDHSPLGRLFTILLLLSGMGGLVYAVSAATAFLVEGQLGRIFLERRMQKAIEQMSGHVVVCGEGPIIESVRDEMSQTQRPIAWVVPPGAKVPDEIQPHVVGEPDQEDVLLRAGVPRAAGMIVAMANDRDNVLVTLTAHQMAPGLRIVAMATDPRTEAKLRRAGASDVVFPLAIGGLRLASVLVRPAVVTFLDTMLRASEPVLRVEEVVVSPDSPRIGRPIGDLDVDRLGNVMLLAVLSATTNRFTFKPDPATILEPGMTMLFMTDVEGVDRVSAALRA